MRIFIFLFFFFCFDNQSSKITITREVFNCGLLTHFCSVELSDTYDVDKFFLYSNKRGKDLFNPYLLKRFVKSEKKIKYSIYSENNIVSSFYDHKIVYELDDYFINCNDSTYIDDWWFDENDSFELLLYRLPSFLD